VTDPSDGITPTDTVVTLSPQKAYGFLGFECDVDVNGDSLDYILGGTNKNDFSLAYSRMKVTATDAVVGDVGPVIAEIGEDSTAGNLVILVQCPTVGLVQGHLVENGGKHPDAILSDIIAEFNAWSS